MSSLGELRRGTRQYPSPHQRTRVSFYQNQWTIFYDLLSNAQDGLPYKNKGNCPAIYPELIREKRVHAFPRGISVTQTVPAGTGTLFVDSIISYCFNKCKDICGGFTKCLIRNPLIRSTKLTVTNLWVSNSFFFGLLKLWWSKLDLIPSRLITLT